MRGVDESPKVPVLSFGDTECVVHTGQGTGDYVAELWRLGGRMVRILIGIVLFVIGLVSFLAAQSSPSGGTVWIGGMLVGGLLVVTGLMRLGR